jgi:hypothetical protein
MAFQSRNLRKRINAAEKRRRLALVKELMEIIMSKNYVEKLDKFIKEKVNGTAQRNTNS